MIVIDVDLCNKALPTAQHGLAVDEQLLEDASAVPLMLTMLIETLGGVFALMTVVLDPVAPCLSLTVSFAV
jgi:hypothetical protein